jgi:acetyl-CoA carboxylase/biotin carboxylase 1
MHLLGDKIASLVLAQSAGVPCIPWSGDGLTTTLNADGRIPGEVRASPPSCLLSAQSASS